MGQFVEFDIGQRTKAPHMDPFDGSTTGHHTMLSQHYGGEIKADAPRTAGGIGLNHEFRAEDDAGDIAGAPQVPDLVLAAEIGIEPPVARKPPKVLAVLG